MKENVFAAFLDLKKALTVYKEICFSIIYIRPEFVVKYILL